MSKELLRRRLARRGRVAGERVGSQRVDHDQDDALDVVPVGDRARARRPRPDCERAEDHGAEGQRDRDREQPSRPTLERGRAARQHDVHRGRRDQSQGERQRVAACRALLLNPDLVLADEPTGNLDPDNKLAVLEQLISVCKRHNRILLTVTHDHSLLPSFDRVVDMAALSNTAAVA